MRILVISGNPWDVSNSFGNTFSNLFSGMDGAMIYNICCRNGYNNNDVVTEAIQATDKSVLKSIYKIGYDPFWKMEGDSQKEENGEMSENALKKRKPIHFLIRDVIWKMGRWKKSKELIGFLERVKPDLIYLPIYSQHYICDFQSYIIKNSSVPVIGHITDDVYGMKPCIKGLEKSRHKKLQKKIEALIKKCSYIEVFAKNMVKEYSSRFGVECHLIGKGVKREEIPKSLSLTKREKLKLVYTGVLSQYRFDTLIDVARSISKGNLTEKIELDVYSQTVLTDEMLNTLKSYPYVNFKGRISREQVEGVQSEADMLLHIEGFDKMAVYSSKMSFSTKIIDYMMKGKVIFAVGSEEINSIAVLSEKNLAVVAKSVEEIQARLEDAVNFNIDFDRILSNCRIYLETERSIDVIQEGMKKRMEGLLNENSAN